MDRVFISRKSLGEGEAGRVREEVEELNCVREIGLYVGPSSWWRWKLGPLREVVTTALDASGITASAMHNSGESRSPLPRMQGSGEMLFGACGYIR